jgi:hypothetical protein
MHAPPKPDYPVLAPNDLAHYDGFLLGVPTRFGNMPAQFKVRIYSLSFCLIGLELAFVGLVGWHWPALATGKVERQVCWRVCFDRRPRWRPGGNCHIMPLDFGSSWRQLYSPWLCKCLRTVDEP